MKKYEWSSVECSVPNHIVEVVEGEYFSDTGVSFRIADELILNSEWGEIGPEYDIAESEREIPNEINIIWFSYNDNKFFQLNTELKELKNYFNDGLNNKYSKELESVKYICLGLGPHGGVNLWVKSLFQSQLVKSFESQEVFYDWNDFIDIEENRKEYVKYINETEKYDSKFNYSFDDIKLFNQYNESSFEFITKATSDLFEVEYFNGEKFQYKLEDLVLKLDKASLPKKITLSYQAASPTKTLYIYFDKDELVDFVKKSQGALTYRFYFNIYNNALKIEIYDKAQNMEFIQFDYEIYK